MNQEMVDQQQSRFLNFLNIKNTIFEFHIERKIRKVIFFLYKQSKVEDSK